MKAISLVALVLALTIGFASTVSAHVTVLPKETTQGSYEVFTFRVPTEKEVNTTELEVKFPPSVTISRVQPQAGWSYAFTETAEGIKTGIRWTTDAGGLAPNEFGEFRLSGKIADDAEEIIWKAYQTYADGEVVEWVGGEGVDYPAPVTTIVNTGSRASVDNHHAEAGASSHTTATPNDPNSGAGITDWLTASSFYISIVALALGLIAILLSIRWRNQYNNSKGVINQ